LLSIGASLFCDAFFLFQSQVIAPITIATKITTTIIIISVVLSSVGLTLVIFAS
jgi:hypothetical protein